MTKKFKITKEGLEELKRELEQRTTVIRKRLQDQLDQDLQEGDISENANYYRLQDDIGSNDKRIDELEELINKAVVVSTDNSRKVKLVDIGSTVRIKVKDTIQEYEVVGATESDPANNRISIDSPMGVALAGKKSGDTATVQTPNGPQKYGIIDVL